MSEPRPTLVSLICEYQAAKTRDGVTAREWTTAEVVRANEAENAFSEALAETPERGTVHDGVLYKSNHYAGFFFVKLPQEAAEIDRQAASVATVSKPLEVDLGSGAIEAWGWRPKKS